MGRRGWQAERRHRRRSKIKERRTLGVNHPGTQSLRKKKEQKKAQRQKVMA